MNFEYVKIKENLDRPAFLVGNGINLGQNYSLSWKKLLKELFEDTQGESLSIDSLDALTYPEMASLANVYRKKKETKTDLIHKKICKRIEQFENEFQKKNSLEKHKTLMKYAMDNNIPVLTTNYDHLLLKSIGNFRCAKNGIEDPFWLTDEEKGFHYWTPLNAYFTNGKEFKYNKTDVKNNFAVWFLHGTKRFSRSICIDDNDYIRYISAMKTYLTSDLYEDYKNWEGRNTWLDIFMHNDLIILGFGFSRFELDLRWLLLRRYAYQKYLNKNKKKESKIFYVHRIEDKKDSPLKQGDREFFEALGVTVVDMPTNDIYFLKYLHT